jgi:cytochrome o ubiquinol oxidase subunit 3
MNDTAVERLDTTQSSKTMLGFWIYLMTDCVLFASLFATYAVLHGNTFGGPTSNEIFDLPFVLVETLILLTSSFTAGLAILSLRAGKRTQMMSWFMVTFVFGLAFLVMELTEFSQLAAEGNSWSRSAFLSAFFTLVGTHGLHIATGLFWMIVLLVQAMRKGLTEPISRRLTLLSMFWHFLDIIWIFIFTIVYLMGVL